MKLKIIAGLVFLALPFVSHASEVSRNNYVDWVIASSAASSNSHVVQWLNPIHTACEASSLFRTLLSVNDEAVLSLLLTAKVANKKVGFYYNTTTTLSGVPGHGTPPCEIVNAWLESD